MERFHSLANAKRYFSAQLTRFDPSCYKIDLEQMAEEIAICMVLDWKRNDWIS